MNKLNFIMKSILITILILCVAVGLSSVLHQIIEISFPIYGLLGAVLGLLHRPIDNVLTVVGVK